MCACSGAHASSASNVGASAAPSPAASATPSPAPLEPCETRELRVDDADLTIESNANATLASIVVESAPNASAGALAVKDVERTFGAPSPDPRVVERPWKLGLTQKTDPCGRPITP